MLTAGEIEASLIERHGSEVHSKLKNASAAIAGLGGLGSNIAVSLVRAGVGKLLLVDFDKVDISNLNRQQYFIEQLGQYKTDALTETLRKINPYTELETVTVRVTEDNAAKLFREYPIVCEAFDRAENKAMLVNTLLEQTDSIIVSGSGMAGYGRSNEIETKRIMNRLYICGDRVTDSAAVNGLMAPRVMMCAAHQANKVIELIIKGEQNGR
ncbi:MAG: sulfur carrier protein ThiS adenylyltransferase ThiF [bacterium]|nr:sulfur carrier protein ThiS adenylyltransferase ThiF [bacterium]